MRILLGVTGCIAAYKACEVLRCLQKAGADVEVVMTAAAAEFVGPQTFAALSGHPVGMGLFGEQGDPIPHIRLGQGCDGFLIAPCTADVLAKLAAGIADDLLTSAALACPAPIIVAPAMNAHMYGNAATQANIATLKSRGIHVLDPDSGHLACGDTGPGRLPEPAVIARAALGILGGERPLAGKRVLITSGPTVEPIDAVRFLSNRSSGKMGAALARAALEAGAEVAVASGPVQVAYPAGAEVIAVQTAQEMLEAAQAAAAGADIIICAAAVADYRPREAFGRKLKKGADDGALESIALIPNPDILAALCRDRRPGQLVIGFAAETDDVVENGRRKLASKGADMIVANQVGNGLGFGTDDDAATLITATATQELPTMPKDDLAAQVIEAAAQML